MLDANDPRIVEIARVCAEQGGAGSQFFIAVAFVDAPGISTISNIASADRQSELLRVLLRSFESGAATTMGPVSVQKAGG